MTTLEYIQGDPMEKAAQAKMLEQEEKAKKIEKDKARKKEEEDTKKKEIDQMTKKIKAEEEFKKDLFGYISTLIFIIFLFMHLVLALEQYACYDMNKFNKSVALSSLP